MDLTPFERAGFYDPAAPDADDKRAMIELLVSFGASTDEILEAVAGDFVHAAGLEPLLRKGDCSVREAAAQLDVDVEAVAETYRLLGIRIDDFDAPILRTEEIEIIRLLQGAEASLDPGEIAEINRTTAAALTTLTDAIVAVFVSGAETRLQQSETVGWAERTAATQLAGELGLRLGDAMSLLFRHHLRQAVDQQRTSMSGASDRNLRTMTVGFVDLVGFTSLSASMDVGGLVDFIRDFEARSYDVASRAGGRLVKIIGDEVMISALTADVGCDIVLRLIEEFRTGGTAPRAGIASGEMIGRFGDLFGPVVNLASRLVDHAVPGEVLADARIAGHLGERFACDPAGRRMLKGFPEPVEVVSVRPR